MSEQLQILDQMRDAADDRARALILLRCPDQVMLAHETAFLNACRHFAAGEMFVLWRTNAMRMVRTEVGGLPGKTAMEIELMRAELAAFAAGAPTHSPPAWPTCGDQDHGQ